MKISVGDLVAYAIGWSFGSYLFDGSFDWHSIEFVAITIFAEKVIGWFSSKWENAQ